MVMCLGGVDIPLLTDIAGIPVDERLRGVAAEARHNLISYTARLHVKEVVLGDAVQYRGQRRQKRVQGGGSHAVASRGGSALVANALGDLSMSRALLERRLVGLEVVLALHVAGVGDVVGVTGEPPAVSRGQRTFRRRS